MVDRIQPYSCGAWSSFELALHTRQHHLKDSTWELQPVSCAKGCLRFCHQNRPTGGWPLQKSGLLLHSA